MKILIVSQYYYPERVSVSEIAENLVTLGNEVTVLTAKPNYGFNKVLEEYKKVDQEIISGVTILRINISPRKMSRLSIYKNYLSFYLKGSSFMRKFKEEFDLVLSVSLSPVISIKPAIIYAKKHNVKHVLYCEDLWPESTVITGAVKKNSLKYKILYKWSKSLYKRCDDIIVSSPSFKEYFNNVLNIKEKSFNHVYQPCLIAKESFPALEFGDKKVFVYAGNIGKIQLVKELVQAFKEVKSQEAVLYLMGMGRELESIINIIEENNLSDKVKYIGALPIEKAEQYLWNAECLIVSLKNEGYVGKTIPNKAIQYLKYNRPIIGVVGGDAKDLFKETKGCLISGQNIKDIAESIDTICVMSEQEKNKMGKLNKTYYEDYLSNDKLVSKLFGLIKDFKK